ncbi:MAG: 3'-5' exonuclease domain-containing protein 2 [Deferribacteraceae bacterium]|nr:3'-5' exonuclease domain-containing protein 2 [Deferribacteraceae bacterium]
MEELSVEYINSLPVISFEGEIKVIVAPQELTSLLDSLLSEKAVGIDTESKPSFKRGVQYPVSLLQLATASNAYIVRLRKTGFPYKLKRFFESEVQKIGLGLSDDLRKLKFLRDFTPNAFTDISEKAAKLGHSKVSLKALTAYYMGKRVVKSSKTTNWSNPSLTEKQLRYAATDAWLPLMLVDLIK